MAQPTLQESTGERDAVLDLVACRHWCDEEYDALESRIYALQTRLTGPRGATVRAFDSECVAGLVAVLDALHGLNAIIVNKSLRPWIATQSPLMAYLSAAYVWCDRVVRDLQELSGFRGSASWEEQRRRVFGSASAYITESVEPLFRQVNELCGSCWIGHPLQRVRPSVERLQSELVSLSWELEP